MKWSLDLVIAVALTVLVWASFYFTFPSEPLSAMETVFVLAVIVGVTKLVRLGWQRWRRKAKAGPR